MLIVLCIVVLLVGVVLRQSGLAGGGMERPAPITPAGEAAGVTTGGTGPAAAPDGAPPPLNALGRARGLEGAVRQQSGEYDKRIDAGSR